MENKKLHSVWKFAVDSRFCLVNRVNPAMCEWCSGFTSLQTTQEQHLKGEAQRLAAEHHPATFYLSKREMFSREHIYYQFWENENTQETIISILQQKIGFSGE